MEVRLYIYSFSCHNVKTRWSRLPNWLIFVNGTLAFFNTILLLCRKLTAEICLSRLMGTTIVPMQTSKRRWKKQSLHSTQNPILYLGPCFALVGTLSSFQTCHGYLRKSSISICVIRQSGHVTWVNQKTFGVSLTLFRLGFFGQSVTGGGAPRTPSLYLWNQ